MRRRRAAERQRHGEQQNQDRPRALAQHLEDVRSCLGGELQHLGGHLRKLEREIERGERSRAQLRRGFAELPAAGPVSARARRTAGDSRYDHESLVEQLSQRMATPEA